MFTDQRVIRCARKQHVERDCETSTVSTGKSKGFWRPLLGLRAVVTAPFDFGSCGDCDFAKWTCALHYSHATKSRRDGTKWFYFFAELKTTSPPPRLLYRTSINYYAVYASRPDRGKVNSVARALCGFVG